MKRPFYKVRTIKFQMESAGPPAPSTPSYTTPADPMEEQRKRKKRLAAGIGAGTILGGGIGYGLYRKGKKEIEKRGGSLVNPKVIPEDTSKKRIPGTKTVRKRVRLKPGKGPKPPAVKGPGFIGNLINKVKGSNFVRNTFGKAVTKVLSEEAAYLISLGEQIYNVR